MTLDLLQNLHVLDGVRHTGTGLLLALDLERTLLPPSVSQSDARLPFDTASALAKLIAMPGLTTVIISRRCVRELAGCIPLKSAALVGSYGLEVCAPTWTFTHPDAIAIRPVLTDLCRKLKGAVTQIDGAWVENKGCTAAIHSPNSNTAELNCLVSAAYDAIASVHARLRVDPAGNVIGIYPDIAWDSGSAVQLVRCRSGLDGAPCLIFGDGQSSESLFGRFADQVTIAVGAGDHAHATYTLRDVSEVQIALEFLADFMRPDELSFVTHHGRSFAREVLAARCGQPA
jgi:trehalose-phosphatase